jgi:uncharacterized protein (TIGR00266 family)
MRFEIRNRPDYASLHVELDAGESLVTEAGAMMGMNAAVQMTTAAGGLMAAARRALGGESVFLNTYTGTGPAQRLDLAPAAPGDIVHVQMDGRPLLIQRGMYLASSPGVEVTAQWGGAKGFFSGAGLVLLRATGVGDLFLSTYGAVELLDVDGAFVVDTMHVVAFDESLQWRINKVGGLKSLLLGGEGLVVDFDGKGRVWFQTRSPGALADFLNPFRPVKRRDD